MQSTNFLPGDSAVFLAMVWVRGPVFKLTDVIAAYDAINHDVLSAHQMSGTLNRLVSSGLVEVKGGKYSVPLSIRKKFDAFHESRRIEKFDAAAAFVKAFEPFPEKIKVKISPDAYDAALGEYHALVEEWIKSEKK